MADHRHSWSWISPTYRKCLICGVEQAKIKNYWTEVPGTRTTMKEER